MNMDNIASTIQLHINKAFMFFLQRKYPDRTFTESGYGGLEVDGDEDVVYNAMVESMEPQWVEPHERRNKEGGVSIVKGYWKQPKSLMALDVANLEVRDAEGKASGLNIEAELEEFIDGLLSGTISLANMNFKG